MTNHPSRQDQADAAADCVLRALMDIQAETGIPTDLLLAGACARIAALMTSHLGGEFTADHLTHVAASIRDLPSVHAGGLAGMPPAGRA